MSLDKLRHVVDRWKGYGYTTEEILNVLRNPTDPSNQHLALSEFEQYEIDDMIFMLENEDKEFSEIFELALERRRNDPNTPRCAMSHCKKPSMVMREFDVPTDGKTPSQRGSREPIPTQKIWLMLCEDCEDGLLWSSKGFMPQIKKACEGKDLRS